MTQTNTYPPEIKFCVKYLNERGYKSVDFPCILQSIKAEDPDYNLVKKQTEQYFIDLAAALRLLWPAGMKDGKYEWRESVGNLSRRLMALWRLRQLKEYPIEVCLSVAQRYLSSFENKDTKYMQTLRYFVMKEKHVKGATIYDSKFADMLEGKSDDDAAQNEWEEVINSVTAGEGILI